MNPLRLIRNSRAVVKIARMSRPEKLWGPLAAPIYPGDTEIIMRAVSILTNVEQHDGALTPDQARDVCNWYNKELTK